MYTIITLLVEKECVSNICFVGWKQKPCGGERRQHQRRGVLHQSRLSRSCWIVCGSSFDHTVWQNRQELCESELTWPSIPPKDLFPYQCKLSCTWWLADVCTWLSCTWRIKLLCTWLVPANCSIIRNHLLASFSPWRQINILNFLFAGAGGLWRCCPNVRF